MANTSNSMNTNITNPHLNSIDSGGNLILPIRTEKQISTITDIELNVGTETFNSNTYNFYGQDISARLKAAYTDYVIIKILGRGGDTPGVFDPTKNLNFWFLINPSEVQVSRSTVDEQSFGRGGWQIGVWGEDFISINISGKTPGFYFDNQGTLGVGNGTNNKTKYLKNSTQSGLVDEPDIGAFSGSRMSMSYRNLLALEIVFENNGNWYEGEQQFSNGPSYRQIKMHQDVELQVGEYIWRGMFESMDITEDATKPFIAEFSLSFVAWEEKFDHRTPYNNPLGPKIQFGHTPVTGVVDSAKAQNQSGVTQSTVPVSTQGNMNVKQPPQSIVNGNTSQPSTAPIFLPW